MKKIYVLALAIVLCSASAAFAAKGFPKTLADITLGENMEKYTKYCNMELASPIPDAPFLTEVHIPTDVISGIRGGSLTYANNDEKLVRIKLKFHDRRQKFFDQLLTEYTKAFGKPDTYRGDSFRNVIAWEWVFTKADEKISLILMWSRERELRPGVSIKMTYDSLVDEEITLFKKKYGMGQGSVKKSAVKNLGEFVPR